MAPQGETGGTFFGDSMRALLAFSRAVDGLNSFVGRYVIWLILGSTLISGINAAVRKAFNTSSNAYLEVQWYLFAPRATRCSMASTSRST